jgi:hypothetical protein
MKIQTLTSLNIADSRQQTAESGQLTADRKHQHQTEETKEKTAEVRLQTADRTTLASSMMVLLHTASNRPKASARES